MGNGKTIRRRVERYFVRAILRPLALLLVLVTGCSVAPVATNTSGSQPVSTTNVAQFKGIVHGGQQPIVGAQVYLLAVSASGQSTSLLQNTANTSNTSSVNGWYYVPTHADGGFSIGAGDYACGSPSTQQVYVYSVNGNPQLGGGDNSAAGLMAVVGPCTSNNFTALTGATVQVNEVTTIAAAYALAGFATDATDIAGSSATAVANAASSAANLASLTTGQALATTPGGNGTVPQDEISTLADILAECINSSGPTSSSCAALFSDAKSGGASGTTATDTATAAIYIAHNPGINLSTLVSDIGSSSDPFTDHLSSAPHDWTIAITYTGGGLNQPNGIAVDGSGNVWTANQGGASISKFSTIGVAAATNGYPNAGLSAPKGIAIDGLGNVWVANSGNNTVSEYSGSTFSSPSGGTLSAPTGIAIDSSNDVWVASNGNNSVSEFVSGTGTQYLGGGLDNPLGIALDAFGNVWVADNAGTRISEFSSAGGALSGTGGDTGGGLNGATGVAVDASSDVWVTNQTGNSLSEFGNSGTAISGSGLTGGGLSGPEGIGFDGLGNVWVANGTGNSISEYSPGSSAFVTGTGGYEAESPAPLNAPMGIAVDPSGNVWVANNASGANSITEFVGAATPVTAAPLVNQPFNLEIGTTSLPNGQEGTAYSATLQAGGGTKPYTWAQTGGTTLASLGLSLNTSTGVISGTPTAAVSNASLTFQVTDSSSPTHQHQSVTLSLTITTASGITVTVSPRNSGITTNQTLSLTATTNDGNGVNWSASAGTGTTCSGTGCGTFSTTNTQTGVAVVYTPPATAGAYIITATSASETSVTASVHVGVTDLAGMTTYHADNSRDGVNAREFALYSLPIVERPPTLAHPPLVSCSPARWIRPFTRSRSGFRT
jgi:streptogramin lyase